jgi:putative transposase
MILNELGQYTTAHRQEIPNHYPMVDCHEFVCMPNHIHGILVISDVGTQFLASDMTDLSSRTYKNISMQNNQSSRTYKNTSLPQSFMPKSGSLGAIIRGFKIGIKKYARENDIAFARQ